jgi:hypothetical protein
MTLPLNSTLKITFMLTYPGLKRDGGARLPDPRVCRLNHQVLPLAITLSAYPHGHYANMKFACFLVIVNVLSPYK